MSNAGCLASVLAGGMLAGIALDLLIWVVARYGPQACDGQTWSFRGNGALIIPFGLGPAVLATGWTALVLHYRSVARWQALSMVAGIIGAGVVLAAMLVVIRFGSAAQLISDWLSLRPIMGLVLAPLLARVLPGAGKVRQQRVLLHISAGPIFAIALVTGFASAGLVLPAGS